MSSERDSIHKHLQYLSANVNIPDKHVKYLRALKMSGVEPKVIYDIGACILQWTRAAKELWPDAQIILFDAYDYSEPFFRESGYPYHLGVLSNRDNYEVKFYQNDYHPGGNSYYKEWDDRYFPPDRFRTCIARTLDSVVAECGFPKPDLVKIDVQGAEKDIIEGAVKTFADTKDLIVEMQCVQYNLGAPLVTESRPYIESLGWKCVAPLFCNNGPDGDYHFTRAS